MNNFAPSFMNLIFLLFSTLFNLQVYKVVKLSKPFSDSINPLSSNSDQDQFSLNDIHTVSRDLDMRIYKMNTYCFALIFYQILSTHSLRKYIKISLENLYVDIMGLKGLKGVLR